MKNAKEKMIKFLTAEKKDKKQLAEFFKHYKNKKIAKNRVNCYLSHNSTILAKNKNKIIGILQYYIKENPNAGVAEFEEVNVIKDYRGIGIGSSLVEFAIKDIIKFFKKNKIKPRKIYLFVGKNNNPARKLYEKFNFKFISEAGNLFDDKELELFYCLDLQY